MGRYYSGDIEGVWFAVQNSDDADFWSAGYEPEYLQYDFDTDHLRT